MEKQRGYPDRRGMGAQSDFLSETFVPSVSHRARQLAMARMLVRSGQTPEEVAHRLSLPLELVLGERTDDVTPP